MKKLLVLSFVGLSLLSYSQETRVDKKVNSKWSIGVNASAGVGYRFFTNVSADDQFLIDFRDENDRPGLTYGGGLFTEWDFHDKFSASVGVHYSKFGCRQHFDSYWIDNNGDVNYYKIRYDFGYHRVGIPLNVKYKFLKKGRAFFFTSVGVDMDFLFMNSIKSKYLDNPINDYSGTEFIKANDPIFMSNIFSPTLHISFGVDVVLKHSKIRIEPFYKMNMRTIAPNTGFNTYFFKGGLKVAYLYTF